MKFKNELIVPIQHHLLYESSQIFLNYPVNLSFAQIKQIL